MSLWDSEFVFSSGDLFFQTLLEAIRSAKRSIHLQTYIFERDSLGLKIIEALKQSAARGVKVRLLLDGLGCAGWNLARLDRLRASGVEVKVYHPLPWQVSRFKFIQSLTLSQLVEKLWKLNRRNHRKSCVVDGETAYVGGMNISAKHLKSIEGKQRWRDTSVCVSGRSVAQLEAAFLRIWNKDKSMNRFLEPKSNLVRLNSTWGERRATQKDLIQRIIAAKSRVWITTPYLVPEPNLLKSLRIAAKSGTDVRLLVPKRNDIWFMKWMSRSFYDELLDFGIHLFEYQPRMLHAKTYLIDTWCTVGSTNINHRSFLHDLEVDVVLSQARSLKMIEDQFLEDFKYSAEINVKSWKKRSWLSRLLEFAVSRFRHWA